MSQAENEPTTNHIMLKLTADEVSSLADRTYRRGISRVLDDMPSVQADMRQAARVIWALVTAYELAARAPATDAHHRGRALMVARIRSQVGFRVAFERNGRERDSQVAPTGERALKLALLMLAKLDDLRDGDMLLVTEVTR
jgi:hypothetical protein